MVAKHTLRFAEINKDIFQAIRDGRKKVETRAGSTKYQKIKSGDVLVLSCSGKKFEKKIQKVRHFSSIKEILKKYKPEEINPKTHSLEETEKMYYSFTGYKEKIKKLGLFAFELE